VVVLEEHSRGKLDGLADVGGAAAVRDAFELQLLDDADLANDVDLLIFRKVVRLEVGGGRVRGGVDLLGGDGEAEGGELGEVARARLGRVVGDEDELLALLGECGWWVSAQS
jgi:hypothetical protein